MTHLKAGGLEFVQWQPVSLSVEAVQQALQQSNSVSITKAHRPHRHSRITVQHPMHRNGVSVLHDSPIKKLIINLSTVDTLIAADVLGEHKCCSQALPFLTEHTVSACTMHRVQQFIKLGQHQWRSGCELNTGVASDTRIHCIS